MKTLIEYIKENRASSAVKIEDRWDGEMYIGTRALFYDVPTVSEEKSVFAFLSCPKMPKPEKGYPAVLLIHGGNGQAFYEMSKVWADKGFVVIAPDFNGKYACNINDRQRVNDKGGNAGYGSIKDFHDKDTWAYFSVLSAMRAIDVLFSLDFVDKDNVFSAGLSWGGFLQLLLSSVENRLKAAAVIYSSAYISKSEWGKRVLSELSDGDRAIWNKYIAPENYIKSITHPIFFTAGADDQAFKMEGRRLTATDISAPVYFGLRKNFTHANFYGFEQPESAEFFRRTVNGEKVPQPKAKLYGGKLTVNGFEKTSALKVCYTKDDVVSTEIQEWAEIKIKDGETLALEKDVTALFVTERLKDGTEWSSEIVRIK